MAAAASPSREELVCTAELSEKTQRYDDMLEAIANVAKLGTELTLLEKDLFSKAYHSVIDQKFTAWHIIAYFQLQERKQGNLKTEKAAVEFRLRVEAEIEETCYLVINIIEQQLLKVSSSADNLMFCQQMKGNCYKTLAMVKDRTLGFKRANQYGTFAELKCRHERLEASEQSLKSYTLAWEIAKANLRPTNPIWLTLALDFSEFFYELPHSYERAYQVAKEALDAAESELAVDGKSNGACVQVKHLMGLLRDRLALWKSAKGKGTEIEHKNEEGIPEDGPDGAMEQKKKLEETDQLLVLSDEEEERYKMARYMSGNNMTPFQRVFWRAVDRYTT